MASGNRAKGASENDAMPLFRYFLAVGTVLAVGLVALSAYLEPQPSSAGARMSVSSKTTSLLYFGPALSKAASSKAASSRAANIAHR